MAAWLTRAGRLVDEIEASLEMAAGRAVSYVHDAVPEFEHVAVDAEVLATQIGFGELVKKIEAAEDEAGVPFTVEQAVEAVEEVEVDSTGTDEPPVVETPAVEETPATPEVEETPAEVTPEVAPEVAAVEAPAEAPEVPVEEAPAAPAEEVPAEETPETPAEDAPKAV